METSINKARFGAFVAEERERHAPGHTGHPAEGVPLPPGPVFLRGLPAEGEGGMRDAFLRP